MNCERGQDGKCTICGWEFPRPEIRRNCSGPASDRPSALTRISSWAAAFIRWQKAGRPVRTQEQINEILNQHCNPSGNPCEHFRAGVCKQCGCRANSSKWGWFNKLAMGTESCPIGLWGAIAQPDHPQAKRVRVGFVAPSLLCGGAEQWHLTLIAALNRRADVDVSGLAFVGPSVSVNQVIAEQLATLCPVVAHSTSGRVHRVSSAVEAVHAVAAGSDVLVAWAVTGKVLEALKATELPVIGVSHCCDDVWKTKAMPTIKRWVAVSAAAQGPISEANDVTVINNGIDLGRLTPTVSWQATRRLVGIPAEAKVIVSVGRLSGEKRLQIAVESLKHLPDDWWLWLVGDGPERERLKADRVVINPSRPDVGNVYAASDFAVLLSRAEGYGLAPVEALAAGLPLVATPVGVLPELWPSADFLPLDPTPADVAGRLIAVRMTPEKVRLRIMMEHSADAMADRWATYLAASVEAHHANRM